ncbi:MAG TPA: hypothetical protein VMA30_09420 [Xanthobacteraceae bacterium]|nr:hypothetical protein [Xanthobacteraceae bacterium]
MAAWMHSCADQNAQIGDNIFPESLMHQLSARAATGHIATTNHTPIKCAGFIAVSFFAGRPHCTITPSLATESFEFEVVG